MTGALGVSAVASWFLLIDTLAATAMGGFLLARHPQIRLNLSRALSR